MILHQLHGILDEWYGHHLGYVFPPKILACAFVLFVYVIHVIDIDNHMHFLYKCDFDDTGPG